MNDNKETLFCRCNENYCTTGNNVHMNSQRMKQHTQGLHRSLTDGVPVLRGENRYEYSS